MLTELLATQRRVPDESRWQARGTMVNPARVRKARGEWAQAESVNRDAVVGARQSLPAGHWILGVFIGQTGATLRKLEQYKEAAWTLLEAHAILLTAIRPAHARTAAQVEQIVTLYEKWGGWKTRRRGVRGLRRRRRRRERRA